MRTKAPAGPSASQVWEALRPGAEQVSSAAHPRPSLPSLRVLLGNMQVTESLRVSVSSSHEDNKSVNINNH